MIHLDAKTYEETCGLKRGERELEPVLKALKDWIRNTYGVEALNFRFDHLSPETPRLTVIMNSRAEYHAIFTHPNGFGNYDPLKQQAIADQLARLAAQAGEKRYPTENLFVCFLDFEMEAVSEAFQSLQAGPGIDLKQRFPECPIWGVHGIGVGLVVFYETDDDVRRFGADGTSERIRQAFLEVLVRQDPFGYARQDPGLVQFDSHETVDRDYSGNLYYYFK